jgi:hypothetical protein
MRFGIILTFLKIFSIIINEAILNLSKEDFYDKAYKQKVVVAGCGFINFRVRWFIARAQVSS